MNVGNYKPDAGELL